MDKLPVDPEVLKRLLTDPLVMMVMSAIAGAVVTLGVSVAASVLRFRGKQAVERAKVALAAAKLTPDEHDDAVQQMALARAEADQAAFDSLAAAVERIRLLPRTPVPMPTVTLKP